MKQEQRTADDKRKLSKKREKKTMREKEGDKRGNMAVES